MWRKLRLTKRCLFSTAWLLGAAGFVFGGTAAETAAALRDASFDPARCYRVRDVSIIRDEMKLFLTDGYLILSKPIEGQPVAAYFTTDVEGGDAEALLVPPSASERASLAHFTQTPTLNEHFKGTLLLFSDGTGAELEAAVAGKQPSREMGELLAAQWTPTLRSLAMSFETRLIQDLAGAGRREHGLFFAALANTRFGNFDLIFDPQARDEITVGHLTFRDNRSYYDIWTSFPARRKRNAGTELDFKIQHVKLEAALDAALRLRVKTTLRIEMPALADRKRLGALLPFDISRQMQVSSARVDGQPVGVYQRESLRSTLLRGGGNEIFLVSPPLPLSPGVHEVEIEAEGDVVHPAGNGVFTVNSRGTWYPHHGTQFATYEIAFRHLKTLTVVASGDLISETLAADPLMVDSLFRSTAALRFAGFNLGEYKKSIVKRAGLTVEVYANKAVETALAPRRAELIPSPAVGPPLRGPGRRAIDSLPMPAQTPLSPAQSIERLANEVGEAYEFFAAKFGPPPLKTLAVSPIPGTFGQGFPGLIYLSTLSYLDPADRPAFANDGYQRTFFSDILVAHEVAHQWWGNRVASTGYQEEWMMEALANYSALMLVEKRKGAKALDQILDVYRQHLLAKTKEGKTIDSIGPIRLGVRLETSESPLAWRTITYEKGTWILHMLRKRVGEAAWGQLLAKIAREYQGRRLSADAFIAEAAKLLPKGDPDPKLENFAGTWISGTGIPTLKLTVTKGEVTVEQSDVDEDFSVDVPIEVQPRGGKSEVRWVRTDGPSTSFRLKPGTVPVKVLLDPQGTVLATKSK